MIEQELIKWWEEFNETRDLIQDLYKEVYGDTVLIFGPDEYGLLFPE